MCAWKLIDSYNTCAACYVNVNWIFVYTVCLIRLITVDVASDIAILAHDSS